MSKISFEAVWIEVDLNRILGNLTRIREKADPAMRVMAVVKANAYGHGLVPVAKALEGHVDFLGIGSLKEASLLREQGIGTPLFLFGRLFPEEAALALQMNLVLTLSSLEEAYAISEEAASTGKAASVHVKVDTGMGRLGMPLGSAVSEIRKIAALPGIQLEGIYTHCPTAERFPDPFTEKQLADLEGLIERLETAGISFPFRHAANSAGALRFKSARLNLIRPGLALYGIYPDPSFREEIYLEPALTLKSRIVFLKRIFPGDSVGYGRAFVAESPCTLAVLPVGYAHGYPFHLSEAGEVLYRGRRFPLAGRICMDSMMVNLDSFGEARIGDEVVLLGSQGSEQITAEELAIRAKTIPYEIVTRLHPGLTRVYEKTEKIGTVLFFSEKNDDKK